MPKPNFQRIFLSGQDAHTRARLEAFLKQYPQALVLNETPHANISGYASTVADEISLILEPLCLRPEQMMGRVQALAESLRISDLLDQHPLSLSGGQTQLVGLASVLVGEPQPLVLPALLQGLDANMRARVLRLLDRWQADVLWTNPAQPFAEEKAFATEILTAQTNDKSSALALVSQLAWQLKPARLAVQDLAISPVNTSKKRKLLTFFRPADQTPSPLATGLNLTLEPGSFLLIRGANGAGKTTFLRTLAGTLTPLAGIVWVGADKIHELAGSERVHRISMVGQHPRYRLIASTLEADLLLGPAGQADRTLLAQLLAIFDLVEQKQTHPHDLTVQQQAVLTIINALLVEPSVLILDEPTVHLTLAEITRLKAVIASYRQAGGTVICVSHDESMNDVVGLQLWEFSAPSQSPHEVG